MRQVQHNQHNKNRSRGRGRRPTNSANRVYESNGPEVKVRGSAQHVAEKYLQLARDAHSSGNLVTAESYYQHAEHYLRIIAANQQQQQQQQHSQSQQARAPGTASGAPDTATSAPDSANGANDGNIQDDARGHGEAAPGSGPQPGMAKTEKTADSEAGAADGAEEKDDEWDGPQPEFLRRPPEGNGKAKLPRKRTPRAAKTAPPAADDEPCTPAPAGDAADAGDDGEAEIVSG